MKNKLNKMLNGLQNQLNMIVPPMSSNVPRKLLKTDSVDHSSKKPSNSPPSSKFLITSRPTPRPSRETHGTRFSNSSPKSLPQPPSKPMPVQFQKSSL